MAIFNKILVATDGSEISRKAVQTAVRFAKENGSSLVGLSVAEDIAEWALVEAAGLDIEQVEEEILALAQAKVAYVAELANKELVPCEIHVARSVRPYEEIVKHADQHHCDAIFMASHGRKGMEKFILGSQTQKVLAHSSLPVVVLR